MDVNTSLSFLLEKKNGHKQKKIPLMIKSSIIVTSSPYYSHLCCYTSLCVSSTITCSVVRVYMHFHNV